MYLIQVVPRKIIASFCKVNSCLFSSTGCDQPSLDNIPLPLIVPHRCFAEMKMRSLSGEPGARATPGFHHVLLQSERLARGKRKLSNIAGRDA